MSKLSSVSKTGFVKRSVINSIAAFGLVIVVMLPPAAAEPNYMTLDPLIVTARGRAVGVTQTPGGVAVVESEDVASAPRISIADLLADVPGITPSGDSPWGRDVSIRGLTGPSVIVMIDGKRINTATDMNARLGLINPKDIERVEVLKGPVSALYGSGSIGGVINIITRKGNFVPESAVHGRVSQSGSTNPAGYDGYANLRYNSNRFWLFGSGAYRKFGDTEAGSNISMPNSQFSDWQGRIAGGMKATDNLTVEMQVLRLEADDVGIPGGASTLPAQARVTYPKTFNDLVSVDAVLKNDGDFFKELQISMYYNEIRRRVIVDQMGLSPIREIRPEANHATTGGKVQGIFQIGNHSIVSGMDVWSWMMESSRSRHLVTGNVLYDIPVPQTTQTAVGLFMEDNWKLSNAFVLNFGARLDHVQTGNKAANTFVEGNETDLGWNIHVGLNWNFSPRWSQSLIAASSYRAADILERFKYINLGGGQILRGNPRLNPEKTVFTEYGLHYRGSRLRSDLRLFFNQIDNYITEARISPTLLEMRNIGKARIYGAEAEARWMFTDNWALFATVTALEGRDEIQNAPLNGIAPLSGTVGIEYSEERWWVRVDTRLAAHQSSVPANVKETAAHKVVNAATGINIRALGAKHQIALKLANIFGEQYQNHLANSRGLTLYEPGFSAMLTHTLEF